MDHFATLSDAQRELLLNLLLRERRELPVVIHHTHGPTAHDLLKNRLSAVSELIERLRHATKVN